MSKDYGSWSVKDLKNELRKRKAKFIGKKTVLVQRLEDHDKMFGPLVNSPESCYKITLPNPENFRDVTSDSTMPILTINELETFCELVERGDRKGSENMYRENFILSCRVARLEEEYFITAQCASQMRKNLIYNVTIKAKDHNVLEAQCKCAAGLGPYAQCKHVLVLLYGAIDFANNKRLNIRSSHTSRLQTFQQPITRYTGNPILAEHLPVKFKDKKLKEMATFDPRPFVEDPEKFKENFNCLIANYCGHGNGSMPIAQLLKPADKRSVNADHQYLRTTEDC